MRLAKLPTQFKRICKLLALTFRVANIYPQKPVTTHTVSQCLTDTFNPLALKLARCHCSNYVDCGSFRLKSTGLHLKKLVEPGIYRQASYSMHYRRVVGLQSVNQ